MANIFRCPSDNGYKGAALRMALPQNLYVRKLKHVRPVP